MNNIMKISLLTLVIVTSLVACSSQSNSAIDKTKSSSAISQGNKQSNQRNQGGFTVNEMELGFESGGNTIYGRVLLPETTQPVPTVILSHGFGGNHAQENRLQEQLALAGIAVYSFDFAGGTGYSPGRSEGDMVDMSVLTEEQNLKDALALVQEQDFADRDRIYLLGASQGGVVTSLVAEDLADQIAGVYLLYPAFSLFEDARGRFASETAIPETFNLMGLTVGSRYFRDVYNVDIYDHLTYSGPVDIFHGNADNLVPISASEAAARTFANARLHTVNGGTHGFSTSDQDRIAPEIIASILGE